MADSQFEGGREADSRPPFLCLNNAIVKRSGKTILHVGSFELAEGESMALLGPNGAGKSTFIKLITREILPLYQDEPPVLFRGNARATLEDVKKSLGIVSSTMQDQITVHMPAIEVVAGGLYGSLGVPKRVNASEDDYARCRKTMATLGVESIANRDVMTLSTGQARRVLFARALVHDPDVVVLDEPCTGLDPQGMHYVRRSMRAIAQSGRAILLVTHYAEDIIPEIERLLLIKDGTVHADGSKEELLCDEAMSSLFDVPMSVAEVTPGHYSLTSEY